MTEDERMFHVFELQTIGDTEHPLIYMRLRSHGLTPEAALDLGQQLIAQASLAIREHTALP